MMLKKNLLIILLASIVVGGIAIKTSPILYESSIPVNQSKASYKEEVKNDTELSIPNSDISNGTQSSINLETENSNSNITKDETSDSSKIGSSGSNISENVQTNIISKSDNSNNVKNSVSSTDNNSTVESSNTITKVDENISTFDSEKNYPTIYYDRTTSIYDDDNVTLLRIEYYSNNKLTYYSDIEQFDATTNSYIEKIFQWDYEKDIEILVRTDIYSNGRLINSY